MSYVSLHKSQLLDSLENQVLYADLCTVIIGEEGLGKSFLISKLIQRLEGQLEVSQIEAADEMSVAQLEKSVGLQLDLSWSETDNLIERVAKRFDRRVLLAVDNAHLLPQTCLEFLMMLVAEQLTAKDVKVFVLLAGDARLARKLNETSTLANNPNICVVFELQAVKQNETKALIADFQSVDEGTIDALYDEQKIDYLWQLSKGNPGDLNYQLNRWMAESDGPVISEVANPSRRYWLSALYTVLVVFLITMLIYQNEINEFIDGSSKTAEVVQEEKLVSKNTKQPVSSADNSLEEEAPKLVNVQDKKALSADENTQATGENPGNPAEEPVESEAQLNPQLNLAESETTSLPNQAATEKARNEGSNNQTPNTQQALPTNKEEQGKTEARDTDTTESDTAEKKAQQVIAVEEKSPEKGNTLLTSDEIKLSEYANDQFVLQWVGVSSLDSANKFKMEHPLKDQMMIFRRMRDGKTLYLVVSGRFNSRIDAENTQTIYQRRAYPGKPWIKSVASIKQDIATIR